MLNMQNVFLCCAIVGGGLFLLRSVLMVMGLGGEIHHHGADVDMSDASHGDSPVAALKLITIHSMTAFLLMFGLVGYLMLQNAKTTGFTVIIAALAGVLTMVIIAKIFQSSRKLQSDGTIYPQDIVGIEGSVYLVIRPGGVGKVQLTVRDALKVFDARAKDPAVEIKTGQRVKVVEAADVLLVEQTKEFTL